ncbi:MAG TPA: PEP/pyruvate-binding domain-containing protein [Anaerolineales bacterium]|nr:PEP/pyruvate-binding domain-containing protein [Anaerolineales bacterium]
MGLQTISINAPYVLPLGDLTRADASRVGAKAANLGELARAGFPVPHGFALTTQAFDHFVARNGLDESQPREKVLTAEMPPEVEDALREVSRELDGRPLAVRSSGVAEDLDEASFAGQYETILGVRGFEELANAVRQCWASMFSGRVGVYKDNKAQVVNASMAVLVQQLIPADAAGVAFTANPVNGRRDETVVSAVRGLGERLVSGEASPDEWIVSERQAIRKSAPEQAVDESQVHAIAEMARRAEEYFGAPQDVEWAIADGNKLFILQARPITALAEPAPTPIPIAVEPPPGFWERDSSHIAEPLSPMFRSAVLPAHERATHALSKALSLPMEGAQFREIGGWVYARMAGPGGKDMPPPPAWLMPILVRVVPQLRKMVKGMIAAVREDRLGKSVDRWYAEWKPETIAGLEELKKVDRPSLTDDELEQHLREVLAFVLERVHIHMLVTAADSLVVEFALACQDLLGWDARKSLALLSGLSVQTTEPTYRLAELARMVRERPAVGELLGRLDVDTSRRLAQADGEFAAAFEAYMQAFAHRTLRWDINEPTEAEQPELILRLIRDQMASGYDPHAEADALARERAAALAEARQLLADRLDEDRRRFERALARAERAYPVREEHEFYLSNAPFAQLRYALLEVGKRMVERAQLNRAEDIMFLEMEEAQTAFRERSDLRAMVIQRKGELAWAKAHPGPASYGKAPPPPPSFDAFPAEARHLMRVLMWQMQTLLPTEDSEKVEPTSGTDLRGLAASAGQYTGPARIVMSEAEFGKLQAGDVLVCPTTQPPWSVLFPSVGALVTDSGGILSHPAIIAREYRIPAVVATGNATQLLEDGQVLIVDGNSGIVTIVNPRK